MKGFGASIILLAICALLLRLSKVLKKKMAIRFPPFAYKNSSHERDKDCDRSIRLLLSEESGLENT
ncbi:MAG: hypothetical protein ACQEQO_10705 [Thermodesulfobacteriota bacterium]